MRADVIEAFIGTYEDALRERYTQVFSTEPVRPDFNQWATRAVALGWEGAPFTSIMGSTNKEILDVYLTWNGILGYTGVIWAITQGEK